MDATKEELEPTYEMSEKEAAEYDQFDGSSLINESAGNAFSLYLKDAGKQKLLSAKEEQDLFARIKEPGVRNEIAIANLKLVIFVAGKYQHRGLPIEDLVGAGNEGLMRAIEKFDPSTGYRFSTYAYHWIRQAITRALADQSHTIRIPVHMSEKILKIEWLRKEYFKENGAEMSIPELMEATGYTEEEVTTALYAEKSTVSLSTPVGEESDTELGDILPDKSEADPAPKQATFPG